MKQTYVIVIEAKKPLDAEQWNLGKDGWDLDGVFNTDYKVLMAKRVKPGRAIYIEVSEKGKLARLDDLKMG